MLFALLAVLLRLGEPAPDFTFIDHSGDRRSLSDFRGRSHVVLIVAGKAASLCQAAAKLEAFDATLLVAGGEAAERCPNLHVIRVPSISKTYLAGQPEPAACLIDKDGIVRRVAGESGLADVPAFVEEWRTGKTVFDQACARCHTDGSYPSLKKLNGIGNRLTKDQILERMLPIEYHKNQISIRSHVLTRKQLDALLVYVAGL